VRAIVASEFRKNAREETERAREKREERNPFDIFRSHKTPHKKTRRKYHFWRYISDADPEIRNLK